MVVPNIISFRILLPIIDEYLSTLIYMRVKGCLNDSNFLTNSASENLAMFLLIKKTSF